MIDEIFAKISKARQGKARIIIAIDGRCASGKTTLAKELQNVLSCNVFHMDDFFLSPEQRTRERYAEPGGNIDRERFMDEVMQPLLCGKEFSYRPFDCHKMAMQELIEVKPNAINIIEGTYSCHPLLWDCYNLHIFLSISKEEQMARIRSRNEESVGLFEKKWIPLEESYFKTYSVEERCELKFSV